MTDYTKLPRDIADCMARAGAPLSEDQRMMLAGYLAPVQQKLEQATARVTELEATARPLYEWCAHNLTHQQFLAANEIGLRLGRTLNQGFTHTYPGPCEKHFFTGGATCPRCANEASTGTGAHSR